MQPEYDLKVLEELKQRAKHQLRRRMRSTRQVLPESVVREKSSRIVARLLQLEEIVTAEGVALYWPMLEKREVDISPLDAELRALGKRIYYPFMEPNDAGFRAGFRAASSVADLVDGGRGFREPRAGLPEAVRGDIDLILAPALAVAADGTRIGYGSGFYDAAIGDHRPPARVVAVVLAFQILAELPACRHDLPVDLAVTEEHVMSVTGASLPPLSG